MNASGAGAVLAAALILGSCAPAGAGGRPVPAARPLAVAAAPVDLDPDHPGPRRIGALIFRGGLRLRSEDQAFGGWSGLWVGEDGRLVAVNDGGRWLNARLESDAAAGAPTGLADARIGALRDERGDVPRNRRARDAEGLARLGDGRFAVSFEHRHRVLLYDLDGAGLAAAAQRGPRLLGLGALRANVGLEAIASAGEGRVLLAAERGGDGARGAPLWVAPLDSDAPVGPIAAWRPPFGFGVSDIERLPDGDFIALQRFYAPVLGARIRIVRISARSIAAGRIEETELALLAPPLRVDNFEGLSAVPLAHGGARLYLISDDNFAPTQRTLLYVFDLPPEA